MPDFLIGLLLTSVYDAAIECGPCENWNRPQEPFHVHGNTWYVGTAGLSAILIDSGDGLVLLDGALPQSAPQIVDNIRALGFDPEDIRMIGISHAHFDHVGGVAALQRISGASVIVSPAAARALRLGALLRDDPQFGGGLDGQTFPAVDNVLPGYDGTAYEIGDVVLTLLHTPGHTVGGTSWTWRSCEEGRCLDIVYADSLTPVSRPGYHFADGLGEKLDASISRIANLDCDIALTTHAPAFGLRDKLEKGKDAFIDANGCRDLAARARERLAERLRSEAAPQ